VSRGEGELLTVPKPRAVRLLSVYLAVKPVGKPDAGNRHVRFDERGWETGRCRMAQATAPILDSTEADFGTDVAPSRRLMHQRSFHFDASRLDYRPPLVDLGLLVRSKRLGRLLA
jgi:hypothetical protein